MVNMKEPYQIKQDVTECEKEDPNSKVTYLSRSPSLHTGGKKSRIYIEREAINNVTESTSPIEKLNEQISKPKMSLMEISKRVQAEQKTVTHILPQRHSLGFNKINMWLLSLAILDATILVVPISRKPLVKIPKICSEPRRVFSVA